MRACQGEANRDPVCKINSCSCFLVEGLTLIELIKSASDTRKKVGSALTAFTVGQLCRRYPPINESPAISWIRGIPLLEKRHQLLICDAHQVGNQHFFQEFIPYQGSGFKCLFGVNQYLILAFLANPLQVKTICTLEDDPSILHIDGVLHPMKIDGMQKCQTSLQKIDKHCKWRCSEQLSDSLRISLIATGKTSLAQTVLQHILHAQVLSTPELGTCLRWHSLHKQFLEVRPQCPCTGTSRRSQRRSWRSPWSPPGQAPKKQNRAVPKWGQCYLLIFVDPWIAIIHVVLIKMSQSITRGFLRTSHQRCGCQGQAANLLNMDLDNASTSVCKVFQSRDCFLTRCRISANNESTYM